LANVGFLGHNIGLLMLQCYSFNSKHFGKLPYILAQGENYLTYMIYQQKKSVGLNNIAAHTWDNIK